jgi:glycosyltransferase involved in cell wall biosynthesis
MSNSGKLQLHIVAFDIPFPPDYGGAIDVFHKVRCLAEAGVEIYLHCPQYGDRKPSKELESLCMKVWYYPRFTGWKGVSLKLPYMVYSRRNKKLLHNLIAVEAPILFDGVSTSYYISHPALKKRFKILRNQNVEQDYYFQLAKREKNLLKKWYYFIEAKMLQRYEDSLQAANAFFTVAMHDYHFFKGKYPEAQHECLPSFQPYDQLNCSIGKSDYCIYHGNLALAENKEAVLFLLKEVVPFINSKFVIAGRNPDEEIKSLASKFSHCRLVANPDMDEMNKLIHDAHVHVLPTFQDTGLKLKLLHALFNGRHVLVNDKMLNGTGLASVCNVAGTSKEMIASIQNLMEKEFNSKELEQRKVLLEQHYNNHKNAERIMQVIREKSL